MTRWWDLLRDDPTAWLLGDDDPSIAFFFLSEVLERPPHSLALRDARLSIPTSPAVRAILSRQHSDGWWETPGHLTEPCYTATLWQLYLLAELGMTGQNVRVATAADFVLETFMTPEGDFMLTPNGPVVHDWVPGLLLWSLHKLGYAEDERIRQGSERMTQVVLAGDGIGQDRGAPACSWAVLPTLWAMSAVPARYRGHAVEAATARLADAFLQHASTALRAEAQQLSFPHYDPHDALYALRVLTALGYGDDPRLKPVANVVLRKQMNGGRWPLERTLERAGPVWGEAGAANRWITLNVLRVLKRVYDG